MGQKIIGEISLYSCCGMGRNSLKLCFIDVRFLG